MVHSTMLVALGFLSACLLALILAPAIWRRAVRLTTKRLKSSLPISLEDFQAEKDQLRAEYAIKIRRMEVVLENTKENAARQLVELNRYLVENRENKATIRKLRAGLAEKKSMTTVLEQTLKADMPRIEEENARLLSQQKIHERLLDQNKRTISAQLDQISASARTEQTIRAEITRLRQALETGSGRAPVNGAAADNGQLAAENQRLMNAVGLLRKEVVKAHRFEKSEAPILLEQMERLGTTIIEQVSGPGKSLSTRAETQKRPLKSRITEPSAKEPTSKIGKVIANGKPKKTTEKEKDATGKKLKMADLPATRPGQYDATGTTTNENRNGKNNKNGSGSAKKNETGKAEQKPRPSLAERLKNMEFNRKPT